MIAIMHERERSECSRLDPKDFSHNIRWRKTKSTALMDVADNPAAMKSK